MENERSRGFNAPEQEKIKYLVNEGMGTLQQIEDLKIGLADTITAVAKELDVPPSGLKKAIAIGFKDSFGKTTDEYNLIETILDIAGRLEK